MPQCDECQASVSKINHLPNNLDLCDSCCKAFHKQAKTHKPGRISQSEPFKQTPDLKSVFHSAKSKVTPELTESLRALPIEQLQEEITHAVAVLTAATSIYGDKWIQKSLENKAELQKQQDVIVQLWRQKQQMAEQEKRIRSLRGTERKVYEKTGKFMNDWISDAVAEFTERLKGELKK